MPTWPFAAYVVAIDGSNVYAPIPGALPCTEAGLVSLGMVIIDIKKLGSLSHCPTVGVDPRELRKTERGVSLGMMLPGQNAAKEDGTSPRTWFREILNRELEEAQLGGESFADTLYPLLGARPYRPCPNDDCDERDVRIPAPGSGAALRCLWWGPFSSATGCEYRNILENDSPTECHHRVRDGLEILALVNTLRYLATSERGLRAVANTAFIMDGPLAALGRSLSWPVQSVRKYNGCRGS